MLKWYWETNVIETEEHVPFGDESQVVLKVPFRPIQTQTLYLNTIMGSERKIKLLTGGKL